MKPFADTRTKRNTAFVVLLAWLFALASGVANACLLETHEPHAPAAMQAAEAKDRAPAESLVRLGPLAANAGHHDDSDGSKESCLKVCGDGSHTLPKAYAAVDHDDPGQAPLVATVWTGSPGLVSVPRRVDALAVPIVGPPLRVRYSRLAL